MYITCKVFLKLFKLCFSRVILVLSCVAHFFQFKYKNKHGGSQAHLPNGTPIPTDVGPNCNFVLGRSPYNWWNILARQHNPM